MFFHFLVMGTTRTLIRMRTQSIEIIYSLAEPWYGPLSWGGLDRSSNFAIALQTLLTPDRRDRLYIGLGRGDPDTAND